MLSESEIAAIVERVVERMRPERIILFGSHAKGTATATSDLDLLVVAHTPLPMSRRAEAISGFVGQALIPIDVHVYTPEEVEELGREKYSFIHSVLTTGRNVFPRRGS